MKEDRERSETTVFKTSAARVVIGVVAAAPAFATRVVVLVIPFIRALSRSFSRVRKDAAGAISSRRVLHFPESHPVQGLRVPACRCRLFHRGAVAALFSSARHDENTGSQGNEEKGCNEDRIRRGRITRFAWPDDCGIPKASAPLFLPVFRCPGVCGFPVFTGCRERDKGRDTGIVFEADPSGGRHR